MLNQRTVRVQKNTSICPSHRPFSFPCRVSLHVVSAESDSESDAVARNPEEWRGLSLSRLRHRRFPRRLISVVCRRRDSVMSFQESQARPRLPMRRSLDDSSFVAREVEAEFHERTTNRNPDEPAAPVFRPVADDPLRRSSIRYSNPRPLPRRRARFPEDLEYYYGPTNEDYRPVQFRQQYDDDGYDGYSSHRRRSHVLPRYERRRSLTPPQRLAWQGECRICLPSSVPISFNPIMPRRVPTPNPENLPSSRGS